jgi:VanZ family protein
MRSWKHWLIVGGVIGGIFYLSSMPGLRVLPFFSSLFAFLMRFDVYFVRAAQFLAERLPIDTSELGPFQEASHAFYIYAKENPQVIEFLLRKAAHAFVFYALTLVLFFALNRKIKSTPMAILVSAVLASSIGALDEFRQSFTDGRVSSLIDVSINMVGVAIAALSLLFFMYMLSEKNNKENV